MSQSRRAARTFFFLLGSWAHGSLLDTRPWEPGLSRGPQRPRCDTQLTPLEENRHENAGRVRRAAPERPRLIAVDRGNGASSAARRPPWLRARGFNPYKKISVLYILNMKKMSL